jgi:hypothetical protein
VYACLARPFDAGRHERRADTPSPPGGGDGHPDRRRTRARAAEGRKLADDLPVGLGDENLSVVGLDRLAELSRAALPVNRRLGQDVLPLGGDRF